MAEIADRRTSAINITSMPDADDYDDQDIIVNLVDHAVRAYSDAPAALHVSHLERAMRSGIGGQPLNRRMNSRADLTRQPVQLLPGLAGDLKPMHAAASSAEDSRRTKS